MGKKKKKNAKDAHKPGRRLEEAVARLEQEMSGTTVKVTSPDFLPDIDTGETREVDVSMRVSVGSSSLLVIVECRDRSRAQDVRWIEELVSKARSVGASKAMAVSPKGFTAAAYKKAAVNNVDLRTLKTISTGTLLQLFPFSKIAMTHGSFSVRQWALRGLPKASTQVLAHATIDEMSKIILFDGISQPISLTDLYMSYAEEIKELISQHSTMLEALTETMENPTEHHHRKSQFEFEISEGSFELIVAGDRYPMRAVGFSVDATANILHFSVQETEAYASAQTTHVARVGLRAAAPNSSSDEIELLVIPGEQRFSITAASADGNIATLAAGTYTMPPVVTIRAPDKK